MPRGNTANRTVVRAGLVAAAALCAVALGAPEPTHAVGDTRSIDVYNVNTKEKLSVTFKRNGRYVPDAMGKLNHMMRDWRRNESIRMDPALIDLIWELHAELGSEKPVQLISGYRSPRTNAALRARGGGQARRSQHTLGTAADIRFPDVPAKRLRNSALIRERGGVGYYPGSNIPFVHVDTANVRSWPRLPRQELAMLFPNRPTAHLPADGRGPLTQRDRQVAMAALRARGESPVQVASARPAPARPAPAPAPAIQQAVAEAPPTPRQAPRPVMASLTPGIPAVGGAGDGARLPWRSRQEAAQPEPRIEPEVGGALAVADLGFTAAFENPSAARMPPIERAAVAGADPELDEEHPEELSYQPYPVLALMNAGSRPSGNALLAMEHPEQRRVGAQLWDSERRYAIKFTQRRSAQAPAPHFTAMRREPSPERRAEAADAIATPILVASR